MWQWDWGKQEDRLIKFLNCLRSRNEESVRYYVKLPRIGSLLERKV